MSPNFSPLNPQPRSISLVLNFLKTLTKALMLSDSIGAALKSVTAVIAIRKVLDSIGS